MTRPISIEVLHNTIYLEERCWACEEGVPYHVNNKGDNGKCKECGGTGYLLTSNGQAIIDLVKKYAKVGRYDIQSYE